MILSGSKLRPPAWQASALSIALCLLGQDITLKLLLTSFLPDSKWPGASTRRRSNFWSGLAVEFQTSATRDTGTKEVSRSMRTARSRPPRFKSAKEKFSPGWNGTAYRASDGHTRTWLGTWSHCHRCQTLQISSTRISSVGNLAMLSICGQGDQSSSCCE